MAPRPSSSSTSTASSAARSAPKPRIIPCSSSREILSTSPKALSNPVRTLPMAESQHLAVKPNSGEDDATQSRTLRDYYIMLRERIWIALPLALLVSVGLGYFQSRATPMYRSTATVQFDKPETIV